MKKCYDCNNEMISLEVLNANIVDFSVKNTFSHGDLCLRIACRKVAYAQKQCKMGNIMNKKIFYYKNISSFYISIIAVIITTCFSLSSAYLLQILLDAANGNDTISLSHIIILLIIFFIGFFLSQMILKRVRCAFVKRAMIQYKNKAFDIITKKNISSFARENTSTYLSALTNDASSIENNFLYGTFEIISMFTSFLGAVILMLWYNWLMTLIVMVLCMLPVVMSFFIGGKLIAVEKSISNTNERFVSIIKDLLNGFTVIKSFQAENQAITLFQKENHKLEELKCNRKNAEATISIISGEIAFMLQIGVFLVGVFLSIKGMITAGVVIAFVQLMNNIMEPIQQLPKLIANRRAAKALIDKYSLYASMNKDIRGKEFVVDIGVGILYKNVCFAYNEKNEVLKCINLTIEKGKSYAIVGSSGSGKSTLINLLLGSYDNYEGLIQIGDNELRNIRDDCLYNLISSVQQNVFIFDSSILNNITMYKDFDERKIKDVIRYSGLQKLIEEKGYDYQCGENGINLSGGERQRISIARSLLKETSVLLLDEATSALDVEIANNISNQILDIEGLTCIIITHNFEETILKRFDNIIVLRHGTVAEQGTFDELMDMRRFFYSLYNVTGEIK